MRQIHDGAIVKLREELGKDVDVLHDLMEVVNESGETSTRYRDLLGVFN